MPKPFRIAVLISGGGTTLRNLLEKSDEGKLNVQIGLVVSSNAKAGGLSFAADRSIESVVIRQKDFDTIEEFSKSIFDAIRSASIDLVVMGGFLKRVLIPADYENRVINIHPSLIPSFCGKGFYGINVHTAVIDFGCKISGCTVHYVDDQYDHGPIIAQTSVPVLENDSPKDLAARVFAAECDLYPEVIESLSKKDRD